MKKLLLASLFLVSCGGSSTHAPPKPEPVSLVVGEWTGFLFQRGINYRCDLTFFRDGDPNLFVGDVEVRNTPCNFGVQFRGSIDDAGRIQLFTETTLHMRSTMAGEGEMNEMQGSWFFMSGPCVDVFRFSGEGRWSLKKVKP